MICNVGGIERPIRIVVGILLIGVGALAGLPTVWMGIVLTLGAVALVTGTIGYCPLSTLFGINTYQATPGAKK
ncbi:MAG: DUF2892 domain-containing protein [Nitrospirae bacterium]|nr:DUF2892 domain-containing protein [Nitrospirota bacterium]